MKHVGRLTFLSFLISLTAMAEFGIIPPGPPGGFGGGPGFGGGGGSFGGGGQAPSGADLAMLACEVEYKEKVDAERRANRPPAASPLGGTQRIFANGEDAEGGGGSGNSTTSLSNSNGGGGGQVTDLNALGLGDLNGVLNNSGGGQGFRGVGETGTTTGSGGNGVNVNAILAGFEQTGRQIAEEEREFNERVEREKWPYIANCIREFELATGSKVEQANSNDGGGTNPLLLQLLLSGSGGDDEDGGEVDFYSNLPGDNPEGGGDGGGDM